MIQVGMILLIVFSLPASASEFTHIRLNPQFEQYLTRPKMKSTGPNLKSLSTVSKQDELGQVVKSALLGNSLAIKSDFTSPFPSDGEESPLYAEIRTHLEAAHQSLGEEQITNLDVLNRQFNLGVQNFSGFSWQKPFGVVHIYANRQVNPNLFGNNWLVQDTFTMDIEATSFLEKLNEAGLTDMTALEIGAFAGITFKRVYTYYHYANSYADGLKADFSKLFLPFLRFNQSGIQKMLADEIMKCEDAWTISAGGLISTPPIYGASFSAGVLAEYASQQMVSVQNNSPASDEDEKIRLAVRSKKSASAAATLSLQLDFFKLLKFTLLSYDLTYEYASGKEFTLGLNSSQLQDVLTDNTKNQEYKSILRGRGTVKVLEPYIVRLDESSSSSLEQRGSVLIWGKLQKTKTEQVRVIKDQMVKVFYKNYSVNMRVVQNFFSRIFSAIVYKIFKFPMGAKNAAMYNRSVTLEYEATHPQSSNPNIARIDNTEQFSFILNQTYEAARTDRWIDKKFKNDVIWFVDVFTTLPKDYKSIIRSEQLKGPLIVESNIRVEKAGFDFVLAQTESNVFGKIATVCGSEIVEDWMSDKKRKKLLKGPSYDDEEFESESEDCTRDIGNKYLSFKSDYLQNYLKPSIARFKDFLTQYYKRSESMTDIIELFGQENTFINGKLQATTSQGSSFQTSFSSGQFRGLGVIDNFKRSNGTRTPASIVSE